MAKRKLDSLKDECSLFSRLFISCQNKQSDLEDFFKHENQKFPPAISQNRALNFGVKSQIMTILKADLNMPVTELFTDALIIDGAALVNTKPPRTTKTFDEYAKEVILLRHTTSVIK